MEAFRKLDCPLPRQSLEYLAEAYGKVPGWKKQEISSQFGGHQSHDFYQGMIVYMYATAKSADEHQHNGELKELAESASLMACAIADGLLNRGFGEKQKTVSHSLLDDGLGESDFKKALQTPVPSFFLKKIEKMYELAQPLAFYQGMSRAAVLVFSTAYRCGWAKKAHNDLVWNYAYLAKIISRKRSSN